MRSLFTTLRYGSLVIVFALFFGLPADGATTRTKSAEQAFQQAKSAFERQSSLKTVQRKHRDRWESVIVRLQGFANRYPDHDKTAEARYLTASAMDEVYRISRLATDARAAAEAYERLAKDHPRSSFAPAGVRRAAFLYLTPLREPVAAYRLFARLADQYPKTEQAREARTQMKKLAAYAPDEIEEAEESTVVVASRHEQSGAAETSQNGILNGIRFWSNPGYTRIVLDLSRETAYKAILLRADEHAGGTPRLYVDLQDTVPLGGLSESSIVNDGMLRQIRTGRPAPHCTRVVLDLLSLYVYKIFTLNDPYRIIIDINSDRTAQTAGTALSGGTIAAPPPPKPVAAQTLADAPPTLKSEVADHVVTNKPPPSQPVSPPPAVAGAALVAVGSAGASAMPKASSPAESNKAPQSPKSGDQIADILASAPAEPATKAMPGTPTTVRRIVVDAGHGGKDPGAVGPSGLFEKNVTLAMARLLAEEISKEPGWEAILTRDSDVFLPLEERTAIANKVGADLFLSIHANASPNSAAYGIETYYLNFSKNEKAAAVAARENGTSLQQLGALEQILFDLMAHSKIQESSRLASDIQSSLVDTMGRHYGEVKDLGVKQGPFYVLLGANMPSVLVETAFISNRSEEARLASRKYQKQAVQAIFEGIRSYAGNLKVVARQ